MARTAWLDALHPDDRDRVLTRLLAAMAAGDQSVSAEYRFRKADGTYAEVLTRVYIVHGARGPRRMIGATMDITARKRAERSYNTQILNSTADGILGLDLEGTATFGNASAARVLGWPAHDLV